MTFLRVTMAAVLMGTTVFAQTAANRTQVSDTVASVDAPGSKLSLKSDKGADVTVTTTGRTLFLRMPPGETDPKKGSKIALTDVAAGDRAVIVAPQGSDPTALAATAVLVMSKSDVASLQQKDV